jgi:hypothetical protein
MKRTLGAFDLTCIGIGAIISSGIFAMTGTAAAGQTFSSRLETPVLNFIQAWCSGGDVVLDVPAPDRPSQFPSLSQPSPAGSRRFVMQSWRR